MLLIELKFVAPTARYEQYWFVILQQINVGAANQQSSNVKNDRKECRVVMVSLEAYQGGIGRFVVLSVKAQTSKICSKYIPG